MCRTFYNLLLMMLSITMLSGCNQPHSKLSGDWAISGAEDLAQRLGQPANAQNLQSGNMGEEQTALKMVLQFHSSGSLKTTTKMGRVDPPPKEGKWTMLAWDESKQTMNIQCTLGNQTTEHEVHFLEPDLIELIPPNMAGTKSRIKFRRMK